MKIGATSEKITELLQSFTHLRDDDNKLIASIWKWQINALGYSYDTMLAHELLTLYSKKGLASAESIRRSRQKIQELNIHLRGDKYEDRQKATKNVIKELKDWDKDKIYCKCDEPYPYYDVCGECGYHLKNIN
tara:strand:- start:357 stop:755 length:399 start_codon:yes stop_codon:yes gene_type:complete